MVQFAITTPWNIWVKATRLPNGISTYLLSLSTNRDEMGRETEWSQMQFCTSTSHTVGEGEPAGLNVRSRTSYAPGRISRTFACLSERSQSHSNSRRANKGHPKDMASERVDNTRDWRPNNSTSCSLHSTSRYTRIQVSALAVLRLVITNVCWDAPAIRQTQWRLLSEGPKPYHWHCGINRYIYMRLCLEFWVVWIQGPNQ